MVLLVCCCLPRRRLIIDLVSNRELARLPLSLFLLAVRGVYVACDCWGQCCTSVYVLFFVMMVSLPARSMCSCG